jgi:hypothetical protein
MNRVVVTRSILDPKENGLYSLCYMQVCAAADASDEEILAVCNRENPSGTEHGWSRVIREDSHPAPGPVQCADDDGRLHILVAC